MTDRMTKFLLALIAVGLLSNAAATLRPARAEQSDVLEKLDTILTGLDALGAGVKAILSGQNLITAQADALLSGQKEERAQITKDAQLLLDGEKQGSDLVAKDAEVIVNLIGKRLEKCP